MVRATGGSWQKREADPQSSFLPSLLARRRSAREQPQQHPDGIGLGIAPSCQCGRLAKKRENSMDDFVYTLREIKALVQQAGERAHCEVVNWRQDPRDSHHIFITARLRGLPSEAAAVQLELLLLPRPTRQLSARPPPALGRKGG
jgi:hypothetical protein